MRSRDKLSEARYFLGRVKECGGETAEFRYLLSALACAARSITLILQADLRPKYGSEFDRWWRMARKKISGGKLSFDVIRDIRNVTQKEGNRIPLLFLEAEYEDEIIDNVHLLYDPASGGVTKLTINLHGDLRRIPAAPGKDLSLSEALRIVREESKRDFREVLQRLDNPDVSLKLKGYILVDEDKPYDYETIVDGFEEYLTEVEKVLDGAEQRFKLDNWLL